MLLKLFIITSLISTSLLSQQAHLLTSIIGARQEIITSLEDIRLVRLHRGGSKNIILSNSHQINQNRDNPKIIQITNDISIENKIKIVGGYIYYNNKLINLSKKIRKLQQAVIWNDWIICVVIFVEASNIGYPDVITSDIVYFKPNKLDGKIIYTGLPSFELQVFTE